MLIEFRHALYFEDGRVSFLYTTKTLMVTTDTGRAGKTQ